MNDCAMRWRDRSPRDRFRRARWLSNICAGLRETNRFFFKQISASFWILNPSVFMNRSQLSIVVCCSEEKIGKRNKNASINKFDFAFYLSFEAVLLKGERLWFKIY